MNSPLFKGACPATDGRIKEGWVFISEKEERGKKKE